MSFSSEITINEFMQKLSSNAPTPGGGGASALLAGVGVALCSMVANLTTGKKKYAEYQEDIDEILAKTPEILEEMLDCIRKDEEAFLPLSKAYGIPKEEPGREEILEKALVTAAEAPLEIMEICKKVIEILLKLEKEGSRLAISDVAVAATSVRAALEGAVVNVYINTKLMKDADAANQINERANALLKEGVAACERVYGNISGQLQVRADKEINRLAGLPVAKAMTEELGKRIAVLKERGIETKLAILRVGEREDDLSYERGAVKRFETAGAVVEKHVLSADCTQEEFDSELKRLEEDCSVHGVLVFRPLPKHLSENSVHSILSPAKDVDCMTKMSYASLLSGDKSGFPPCTPQGVIELLHFYGIELKGKKAVVVGRSSVVGKPLALLLTAENATVTICHTKTKDLKKECREADILIAACGVPKVITAEYVRPGQIVIDVGINVVDGNLCGDVDYEAVGPIVEGITPVPGGAGSVTTAVLLKHTVENAEKNLAYGAEK